MSEPGRRTLEEAPPPRAADYQERALRRVSRTFALTDPPAADDAHVRAAAGPPKKTRRRKRRRVYRKLFEEDTAEKNGTFRPVESVNFHIGDGNDEEAGCIADVKASTREGRPISENTHAKLLRELGFDAVTHGFWSSFRDYAAERTHTPHAVMEAALAHTIKNRAEAAYARSDLFEKRRELMEAWAEYLGGGTGDGSVCA